MPMAAMVKMVLMAWMAMLVVTASTLELVAVLTDISTPPSASRCSRRCLALAVLVEILQVAVRLAALEELPGLALLTEIFQAVALQELPRPRRARGVVAQPAALAELPALAALLELFQAVERPSAFVEVSGLAPGGPNVASGASLGLGHR